MNKDIVIQVQNLSKIYKLYDKPSDRLKESLNLFGKKYHKEFYALKNISFQINENEIVGIIGKNGSGKSTLLKIITGVLTASSGEITVHGKISALLELGAGFNPELTGIENIYFNGMIMGLSKKEINEKLDEIISFADIGEHFFQPVKTYSSGMFVRLAFALAVSVEPEILIIDEALSVGDVRFQQKALRKMKELMEKSKAIIFVTHDMESVKNFCTKVIWLKDGDVFRIGEPKKIVQWYYDYMIHNILPTEEKQTGTVIETNSNFEWNKGIQWDDVSDCECTGNGGAVVKRVAFYTKNPFKKISIMDGSEDKVIFFGDIEINTEIYEPLIGFGIFNQHGVPVAHFNSYTIDKKIRPLHQGERVLLTCELEFPKLKNGTYTVSLGIDDGTLENHIIVNHINDCCVFKIARNNLHSKQYGLVIIENADIQIN